MNPSNDTKKVAIYKEILGFKKCLNIEYSLDRQSQVSQALFDQNSVGIYLNMYRSTFQPIIIMFITLENPIFIKNFAYGSKEQKCKIQNEIIIFCTYLENMLNQKYYDQVLLGNRIKCSLKSQNLVIKVESLYNNLFNFSYLIIEFIKDFQNGDLQFDKDLLNYIKYEIYRDTKKFKADSAMDQINNILNFIINKTTRNQYD